MTQDDQDSHARQEFNSSVGQVIQADDVHVDDQSITIGTVADSVAGRDVVNHHYGQGRLLTRAERADLNKLVRQLEIEFGTPGWQTWKFLHRTIGVENIETMYLIHRDPAETILGLLLDRAKLQQTPPSPQSTTSTDSVALANTKREFAELDSRFRKQGEAMQALRADLGKARAEASKRVDEVLKLVDSVATLKKKLETSQGNNRDLSAALDKAKQRIAVGRRNLAALAIALLVAVTCGAIIWRKADTSAKALQILESQQCMYAGKPYAVGSVIDNPSAPDIECVATDADGSPEWQELKPRRRK
ncbi:hypothetical protein [Burkholderia sp. BCC0397]|uniref:hypothetical protein n=1 Tax=Burkholderia sp. BCC0397 TaxID=486876 RepID=UPI00158E1622|nr:hypothetical protein [Burkholderia sp. BCC0397]